MCNMKKAWLYLSFLVFITIFAMLMWKWMYPFLWNTPLLEYFTLPDGAQTDHYIVLSFDLCMTLLSILLSYALIQTLKKNEAPPTGMAHPLDSRIFSSFFWGSAVIYHLFLSIFHFFLGFLKVSAGHWAAIIGNAALPIIYIACFFFLLKKSQKKLQVSQLFNHIIPLLQLLCCLILSAMAIFQIVSILVNPPELENFAQNTATILCNGLKVPLTFLTNLILNPHFFNEVSVTHFCLYILPYTFLAFFCLRFFSILQRHSKGSKSSGAPLRFKNRTHLQSL